MNIIDRIFPKKKSKENIEAHAVVEEKQNEAQNILKDIQIKMENTAREIEIEQARANKEMGKKVKKIRDVAQEIAIITAGGKLP